MSRSKRRRILIGLLIFIFTSGMIYLNWFWGTPLSHYCNENLKQVSMVRILNGTTGNGSIIIEYNKINKLNEILGKMRLVKAGEGKAKAYRFNIRLFSIHGQVLNVTFIDDENCMINQTRYRVIDDRCKELYKFSEERRGKYE